MQKVEKNQKFRYEKSIFIENIILINSIYSENRKNGLKLLTKPINYYHFWQINKFKLGVKNEIFVKEIKCSQNWHNSKKNNHKPLKVCF